MENITEKFSQSLGQAPLLWGAGLAVLLLLAFYKLRLQCLVDHAAGGRVEVFWRPVPGLGWRVRLWGRAWDGPADEFIGKGQSWSDKLHKWRRMRPALRGLRIGRIELCAAVPGDPALAAVAGGCIWAVFGWLRGCLLSGAESVCRVSLAGEGGWRFSGALEAELRLIFLPVLLLRLLWAVKASHN